jgi:adenylylsulfate kinase
VTGLVVWITGLPGSGKSTLAETIREMLGGGACVLDGDAVRDALVPRPGYGDQDRDDFYASLANIAALLARQNFIVLVPATAHLRRYRQRARDAAPRFVEVHVTTSRAECAARDPKGLWARASAGELENLPGAGVEFEEPEAPDVTAAGGLDRSAVDAVVRLVAQTS